MCCAGSAAVMVLSAFPLLSAIIQGAATQPSNSSHHPNVMRGLFHTVPRWETLLRVKPTGCCGLVTVQQKPGETACYKLTATAEPTYISSKCVLKMREIKSLVLHHQG